MLLAAHAKERKIRLPAMVGLLWTGMIVGPGVINLAGENPHVAGFLAVLLGGLRLMSCGRRN